MTEQARSKLRGRVRLTAGSLHRRGHKPSRLGSRGRGTEQVPERLAAHLRTRWGGDGAAVSRTPLRGVDGQPQAVGAERVTSTRPQRAISASCWSPGSPLAAGHGVEAVHPPDHQDLDNRHPDLLRSPAITRLTCTIAVAQRWPTLSNYGPVIIRGSSRWRMGGLPTV